MKIMGIVLMAISTTAGAWTHPVYKCGNSYSDEPCTGGQAVDIRPTEGAHSMSGKKRLSPQVEMRKIHRAIAEGTQPLTGITPDEMESKIARDRYRKQGRVKIHEMEAPER